MQPGFAAIGLGHRPRPERLELIAVAAPGFDGVSFLLDSPEPVDRARLTLARAGSTAAVRVFWNADGTRAFLFDSTVAAGLFAPGVHGLDLTWIRGGPATPDVPPLYRAGRLEAPVETVRWNLGV